MAKAFYQRPFKATNPQTLRLRSFFPAKLFKRYLDEIVKKDLVPRQISLSYISRSLFVPNIGDLFWFYKAVVPDFFCQFTLFSHFGKLNYPQIKMYVIWALKMCTATPATGCKDINMKEFYNSNINQFFFLILLLLLMRWVTSNLTIQHFRHTRLSFLLE